MADKPSALAGARVVGGRYLRSKRQENPDGRMPLMDHLRELRNRVVKVAIAIIAGAIVSWVFFDRIWAFMQRPYCQAVGYCKVNTLGHSLFISNVMDGFYLHIKVSIIAGAVITSPIWLYQLWAFIAPGLYAREKRWTYAFLGAAVPLFAGGAALAYLVMSRALHYLLNLTPHGVMVLPTIPTYLSYFQGMILGFGVAFELPLALIILNLAHI